LTIESSTISGNSASSGGGVSNYADLTIVDSTISGNTATIGGGGIAFGFSTVNINQSTISGNSAATGGGIYTSFQNTTLNVSNSTIFANSATGLLTSYPRGIGGGIANTGVGAANVRSSIIAGNSASAEADLSGAFISGDYNLIQATDGLLLTGETAHNILGKDPRLGPLQDNGGPTFTHALLAGSPAIDAGATGEATKDQRGEPRLYDIAHYPNGSDGTDIGAFELNVAPPNFVPTLSALLPQAISEDTFLAINFTIGDVETPAAQLVVTVTSSNPDILPASGLVLGGMDAARSLQMTPLPNQFGATLITLKVDDGVDAATGTFLLTVGPVNDLPQIGDVPDQNILEDFASAAIPFSVDDVETPAGSLTMSGSSSNPALVPNGNIVFGGSGSNRTVQVTPLPNQHGTAIIAITVHDGPASASDTFVLNVTAVNDAPSFVKGGDQKVGRSDGPQVMAGWASAISSGPPDEAAQTVTFLVDNDAPALFATPPAISPNGTLTFSPAPKGSGKATVTVRARDNGGTANGGLDTSAPQSFTITVSSFTEEAGQYNGLLVPSNGLPLGHERMGLVRVTAAATGTFTGRLVVGGKGFSLRGAFDQTGVAHFGNLKGPTSLALPRVGKPSLQLLAVTVDTTEGSDKLTGKLTENGATFTGIEADRKLYTAAARPLAPLRKVPQELLGKYTVRLAARTPLEQGMGASEFPQGDGYGTLSVATSGVATLVGRLADGQLVSYANALSKLKEWPFYVPLYAATGSISGPVSFRDWPDVSDCDGMNLHWFKPPKPLEKRYPDGWAGGIQCDLLGAKYVIPPASAHRSVFPGLTPTGGSGNADLALTEGGLLAPGIAKVLDVKANNSVVVLLREKDALSLVIAGGSGLFSGSFFHPATGKRVGMNGVVFQKQGVASGFFLTPTESGSAVILPRR
jgi:hypothetical protein